HYWPPRRVFEMPETGDRDLLKEVFGNSWNRRSGFSETGVHFGAKSARRAIATARLASVKEGSPDPG
ncbi:MAG TPA: hypothetical protein VNN12_07985, partial [Dehalococcoidia bacterium]|nr:hypothetical protein [Dehalococcoidia bacterium]